MAWGHICVRRLLELSARAWSPTPLIRRINIHTHIEYAPNETHTHFFTLSPLPPTIGLLHDPRLCRPHHIKTWTNQPHTLMDTYPHTHTLTEAHPHVSCTSALAHALSLLILQTAHEPRVTAVTVWLNVVTAVKSKLNLEFDQINNRTDSIWE